MQKNQLTQSLWLLLLILGLILIASFVPPFTAGPLTFKKISPIGDIQTNPEPIITPSLLTLSKDSIQDTLIVDLPLALEPQSFPCPEGMTCIEDYGFNQKAMRSFFQALPNAASRPVRIAFYGDSFIEGDILCGNFRDTLQSLYGGRGVGYVPLASEVTQFRTSILHTYSHWKTYSLVGKYDDAPPLGISGYAFRPSENNEVVYKPGRKQIPRRFDNIRIFYQNSGTSTVNYQFNDTVQHTLTMKRSDSLLQINIPEQAIPSIRLHFTNPDSVLLYGVSFEANQGVYVDNFAMRGNSGLSLSSLPPALLTQFNDLQDYKLIILQYGLNMVTESDSLSYNSYQVRMTKVILRLKKIFPQTSILLIGISDRAANINGKIQTLPAIPRMRDAQREIARRTQIAFWDLYTAMGGENTMVNYVAAQPPLGAKDYTHLTFRGGEKVAKKLSEALLYERNRYDKKSVLP